MRIALVLVSLVLVGAICMRFGKPADLRTVFMLAGGPLWTVLLVCQRRLRVAVGSAGFACLLLLWPLVVLSWKEEWDLVGGRVRSYVYPNMRFVGAGPNTKRIQREFGQRAAFWRNKWDRHVIGSLIFRSVLQDMLVTVPGESRRRRVLESLTDPGNYARVHQEMLLTFWYAKCILDRSSRQPSWEQYEYLFRPMHDAGEAATQVFEWKNKVRKYLGPSEDNYNHQILHELGVQYWRAKRCELMADSNDSKFQEACYEMLQRTMSVIPETDKRQKGPPIFLPRPLEKLESCHSNGADIWLR